MGIFDFLGGASYKRVNVQEAHALVQGGAQFIDVRNRGEYRGGHAEGARNIALNALENQLKNLDKQQPVVCICQSGMRSGRAAQLLSKHGFEDVYNVQGGSAAWRARGLPWKA